MVGFRSSCRLVMLIRHPNRVSWVKKESAAARPRLKSVNQKIRKVIGMKTVSRTP